MAIRVGGAGSANAAIRIISQAKVFDLILPVAASERQKMYSDVALAGRAILFQQSAATARVQEAFNTLLASVFP